MQPFRLAPAQILIVISMCSFHFASHTQAATLPDATFRKELTAYTTPRGGRSSTSDTTGYSSEGVGDSGTYAIENANIADGPIPFVDASSQSRSLKFSDLNPGTGAIGTASAQLTYHMRIGGGFEEPVSVLVYARGHVSSYETPGFEFGYGDVGGSAIINFSIFGNDEYLVNKAIGCGGPSSCAHELAIFQRYNFISNLDYLVTISATTTTSAANGAGSSTHAYLDPYFSLSDSDALKYRIELSAGIGNGAIVSAVPLPASAPMFGAALLGLAGLGYGMKRKKAAAAA